MEQHDPGRMVRPGSFITFSFPFSHDPEEKVCPVRFVSLMMNNPTWMA